MSVSIAQSDVSPDAWRASLRKLEEANEAGLPMRGQVAARAGNPMLIRTMEEVGKKRMVTRVQELSSASRREETARMAPHLREGAVDGVPVFRDLFRGRPVKLREVVLHHGIGVGGRVVGQADAEVHVRPIDLPIGQGLEADADAPLLFQVGDIVPPDASQ